MKARKVKGLHPEMALAEAASRIVEVRAGELRAFAPRALQGDERALHDLRIAAKRLRYLLEVMAPALGDEAKRAARRARDLQDVIGEIHDCDVMLPRVQELLDERGDGEPRDPAYRGLAVLAAHLRSRRAHLFEDFTRAWEEHGGALTRRG